jgi:hypothetical protein
VNSGVRFKPVTIYNWPWSQKCMDCKHGEFFQSDTFDTANMLCHLNCEDNNGESCSGFVSREEENDSEE